MVEFAAIPKVDLSDAVVDRLRDAILLGELAPGDSLPSERELVVQLGVNRTTVREGLTRLELLGLVDRRHGRACRVLDYRRSGSTALIPYLAQLRVEGIDASIAESSAIYYEGTVALAVQRATDDDLAALRRAVAVLEEAIATGDGPTIVETQRDFHRVVAAAAHSVVLELMIGSFFHSLDVALDAEGRMKQSVVQVLIDRHRAGRPLVHRRLADAIAAGDEAAARALAVALVTGAPRGRRRG